MQADRPTESKTHDQELARLFKCISHHFPQPLAACHVEQVSLYALLSVCGIPATRNSKNHVECRTRSARRSLLQCASEPKRLRNSCYRRLRSVKGDEVRVAKNCAESGFEYLQGNKSTHNLSMVCLSCSSGRCARAQVLTVLVHSKNAASRKRQEAIVVKEFTSCSPQSPREMTKKCLGVFTRLGATGIKRSLFWGGLRLDTFASKAF